MTEERISWEKLLAEDKKFIRANQEAIKLFCKDCSGLVFDQDYDAYVCSGKVQCVGGKVTGENQK